MELHVVDGPDVVDLLRAVLDGFAVAAKCEVDGPVERGGPDVRPRSDKFESGEVNK